MLIENNTQVLFAVEVKLVFDSGKKKDVVVEEGDYLIMQFMYNGNKLRRACRVIGIQPVILETQPVSYAASLIIDASEKFGAQRLRVASKDILDIRVVDEDFMKSLEPDFIISDEIMDGEDLVPTPKKPFQKPGVNIAGVDIAYVVR